MLGCWSSWLTIPFLIRDISLFNPLVGLSSHRPNWISWPATEFYNLKRENLKVAKFVQLRTKRWFHHSIRKRIRCRQFDHQQLSLEIILLINVRLGKILIKSFWSILLYMLSDEKLNQTFGRQFIQVCLYLAPPPSTRSDTMPISSVLN